MTYTSKQICSIPFYDYVNLMVIGKRVRDAAFFFIIMLVTFAATLLNPQKYVTQVSDLDFKPFEHTL